MAHIDVWYGVSSWVNEDSKINKRNLCSFITDSETPIVKGNSVWNICCEKPVYNDIKLGYEPIQVVERRGERGEKDEKRGKWRKRREKVRIKEKEHLIIY